MNTSIQLILAAILALLGTTPVRADLVVVVNPRSGVDTLSRNEAINIFMGRYRQLPTKLAAVPVDQPENRTEKARFYKLLVGKDLADINAYWTRLVFSGKTNPPHQASTLEEVLDWLNRHPGGIGYLDRSQVDDRVKIVLDLEAR